MADENNNNQLTGTQGHESEAVNVAGLKSSLQTLKTNILDPTANKGISNEATCSTAAATAAKTVTAPTGFSLTAGATIIVTFTNEISVASATLQVGSTAAKPIKYQGAALPADIVEAGDSIFLRYDGTSYNVLGKLNMTLTDVVTHTPSGQTVNLPELAPGLFEGTCSTAAATVAKEVTITNYELMVRSMLSIKFTNGISVANATLNVNNSGAKAIYYKGAALAADFIQAGDIVNLTYNGTQFDIFSIESKPVYTQITGRSSYSVTF